MIHSLSLAPFLAPLIPLFNTKPEISVEQLDGDKVCVVVDNILSNPEELVAYSQQNHAQFIHDSDNYFPGIELGVQRDFALAFEAFFVQHIKRHLRARRSLGLSCRLSMTTLKPEQLHPLQRLCHRDAETFPKGMGVGACVLYLFHKSELGGTGFYQMAKPAEDIRTLLTQASKGDLTLFNASIGTDPCYLHQSNDYFSLVKVVEAKWNRAIFYHGDFFHAAHITQAHLLNDNPIEARLTLNAFFKLKMETSPN